jgi:DNA helicase IV
MKIDKNKLLDNLKKLISSVQDSIKTEKSKVSELINKPLSEIKSLNPEDQMVYLNLKAHATERITELDNLHNSPFFVKCEMEVSSTKEKKTLYFAKHHFVDRNIYSWIAPIARIRFEKPGLVEYKLPEGRIEKGNLSHKEQYLIVDGKIVFFAIEDLDNPRELIYQEHFSNKIGGFVLPEIVAVMEKAQDTVIRAHHIGPFVISGPAGSGKTTLALHRVAYLVQSPDTSEHYPADLIIVFVQDNSTKEYFSHILPELGIKNVTITTFFEWASSILNIRDAIYVDRRGDSESDKDKKEFDRLNQISQGNIPSWNETKSFLSENIKTGIDRIDLTIALKSFYNKYSKFEIKTKYNAVVKGEIKQKTRTTVLNYSLMIIDEFQNYMPEQLNLLQTCININTKSIIYVGDMAQQVLTGTLRSFDSIGLKLNSEREVRLHKVYRNTKQILEYIKNLDYKVEVPEGIKNGLEVKENIINTEDETIEYIEKLVINTKGLIGVIGKDSNSIDYLKKHFTDEKRVYVTTMILSQGVEFDVVCIVGINKSTFSVEHLENYPQEYIDIKNKIQKDILYVALTRAISELHILGTCTLTSLKLNSK